MQNLFTGVYLDNAATTPTDPRVAELVLRLMTEEFGNAGSRTHDFGVQASRRIQKARDQVASSVAAAADEIIFTSGATESDNLALLGLADHGKAVGRRHIITTAIEHKAVLEPLARLEASGFEITRVAPSKTGEVAAEAVLEAVRSDTLAISVMHANNETGAVMPIPAIADELAPDGPYLHVDAAQTFGRRTADLRNLRIDLISLSGHKTFGPKGVGALVARRRGMRRPPLTPIILGGGQEFGIRPGTQPVPLIAGFGLASELATREEAERVAQCTKIRHDALQALGPLEPIIHGGPDPLPNILSFAIAGIDSEAIMVALKGLVALSNGSACTSAKYEPSHVLLAMGLDPDELSGTVRMSWGHNTGPIPWDDIMARLADLRL